MCLYVTEKAKFKIAKEDIICWKILEYGNRSADSTPDFGWYTPYMYYPVNTDVITPAQNKVGRDDSCIESGVIHCHISEQTAHEDDWPNCYVFKVMIPKGTKYIEGKSSLECPIDNYGAKRIKIIDPKFLHWMKTKELPDDLDLVCL